MNNKHSLPAFVLLALSCTAASAPSAAFAAPETNAATSAVVVPVVSGGADLPYRAEFFTPQVPTGWYMEELPAIAVGPSGMAGQDYLYVFNRGRHALLAFHIDGRFSHEIGAGLFDVPHGLRVDRDGNVWTTDIGNHLVLKFSPEGELLMVFGKRGTASAGWFDRDYDQLFFNKPNDVAFDANGNIYVADGGNFRIVKFSPNGDVQATWGEKGDTAGAFNFPHSLLVDGGRLLVADRENQRIQLFSLDGRYQESWSGIGYPYLLLKARAGGFWMSDARADALVKLSADGKPQGRFGGPGKQAGRFGFLHGIVELAGGDLLVSDILNWRIQRLLPTDRAEGRHAE